MRKSQLQPIDHAPDVEHHALALTALNELDEPIAVLWSDRTSILLSNAAFEAEFRDDADFKELRDSLSFTLGHGRQQLSVRGRRFSVRVAPLSSGWLIAATDISDRDAEMARIFEEARSDSLTGLGNRLMLRERLTKSIDTGKSIAVVTLDLDRFKVVNDSLGHQIGDKLLCKVAERIRSVLGPNDYAARFGGDEFCVVQVGQSQPNAASALAGRLVDLIGRSYLLDGHLVNVGASAGLAFCPEDGLDESTILKNADLALYRAKQDGRGRFRIFESAMDQAMQARRNLEIDLRRALALREFELVYQPQYNLKSNQITGFEALLRWNNASRGLISPAEFIPLAEETGLIVPIGEWVLRTACREAAGWTRPLNVAVNVSAIQFAGPNLVPSVISALAESGIEPQRLELEITESVLIDDHASTLKCLQKIRELGVRISMDDFGTGYSSLSYLRSFPFDKIKIDQCFVRAEDNDQSGKAIVRAIAALGQSLGMTTTAEGVETEEQLARILADGCTDVQGYLISKPLPAGKITEFLDTGPRKRADEVAVNEDLT